MSSGLSLEKPTKKFKVAEDNSEVTSSQVDEYARHKASLKKIYESNKWVFSTISSLLTETYRKLMCMCIMFIFILELRRSWIVGDCPPVSEIISEFPCFKEPAVVSNFCYSTFNNFIP